MSIIDIFNAIELDAEEDSYLFRDPAAMASSLVRLESQATAYPITKLRASGLYDACVRQHVLGLWTHTDKVEYGLSFHMKLIFGFGTAFHYWLQNFPDVFGDRRRGFWRCKACSRLKGFCGPPKKRCKCGASIEAFEYHEYNLNLPDIPLTGHPDMFLRKGDKARVAEFKTIEGEAYKALLQPQINHVWQITAYMWLCSVDERLKNFCNKYGYLFYFTKKGSTDSFPVKCFTVRYNPEIVDQIQQKVNSYTEALNTEKLPEPDGVCVAGDFNNYKSNTCPVKSHCIKNLTTRKAFQ